MFKREDYFTIIKIALLEFEFDTMMHVIMLIMVWDVLVHVILKEDVEKEGVDVLVSSIVCVGESKDERKDDKKDGSWAENMKSDSDELQEEALGESQGEGQVELKVEKSANKQQEPKKEPRSEVKVIVRCEELFEANEEVRLSLSDRVEDSYVRSRNHLRFGDYVMLDNVKYFGECNTSIIWSFYVVEGPCIETTRLRYNKKMRGVRCRSARGTVKGLQGMAIFAKEDVGEIITIFKRLCKIKHK